MTGKTTPNRRLTAAREYHELSSHSYWSVRTSPHFLDWENQPSPFKQYRNLEEVRLPQRLPKIESNALEAISRDAESRVPSTPTMMDLALLLQYSAGITKTIRYPRGTMYFRAAACAGALYPIEIYVFSGGEGEIEAGVYHFSPIDLVLRRLRRGDFLRDLAEAAGGSERIQSAPLILAFTAISWRSSWKYRDRAYRYHFWDNGMIVSNALAMSAALGHEAMLVMGFVDSRVSELLGVDGRSELPLSLMTFGRKDRTRAAARLEAPPEIANEEDSEPTRPIEYASIVRMHEYSSLQSADEVRDWRQTAPVARTRGIEGQRIDLNRIPGASSDMSLTEAIERRASTRRFAHRPILAAELGRILAESYRRLAADFHEVLDGLLNELYVIVNDVEGVEPGAYYYDGDAHQLVLLKSGEFRDSARYLTLDQDLGGDASATVFFMTDLDQVLRVFGNRGYRLVQMEAGVLGGRVYLSAYALKRGASGLTFYDQDVTEFFLPHSEGKSAIFVMAVGVPGKRPLS